MIPDLPVAASSTSTSTRTGHPAAGGRWRGPWGVMALVALLVFAGYFARDYFKRLGPPDRCWEIREMEGRLYKMNPCTGQFLLLGDVQPPATGR
ncbi:MAG: hypothetical protein WCI19_11005 [Betaproteobacteria bacterium]|jgi:hypothetical protein